VASGGAFVNQQGIYGRHSSSLQTFGASLLTCEEALLAVLMKNPSKKILWGLMLLHIDF
jgi:hypothetical protein